MASPFALGTGTKSSASPTPTSMAVGLLLLATLLLSACVPILLGVATVTAVDVSTDRRTAGTYWDDFTLEVQLRSAFNADETLGPDVNISVTAFNGTVLLTGEVNSDEQRQRAEEIVRDYIKKDKAHDMANELQLAGKTTFVSRAVNDSLITTKAVARLLQVEDLPPSTVKVVTEHGKVYLMGLVTQAEADAAVEALRTLPGATHIVKVFEYIEP